MGRIFITGLFILCCFLTNALGTTVAPALVAAPAKPDLQRLRWKNKTVKIAVSSSLTRTNSNIKTDSDVFGAIRRSLQAWASAADIDLQLEFSDKQNVSPGGPSGDGVSLITIAQSAENVLFFSKDAESASAKTRIFYNRRGSITEADIVLNPFQQFSTDGTYGTFDLESTLTHEIGHLLGLRHSGVLGATMAESFARNGTMGLVDFSTRTLSESDIAAIRELYGAPSEVESCCGAISGKITTAAGRPGKGLQVWVEESESGRVMAESETAADGAFRIGGLSAGEYSVYWKTKDPSTVSSFGQIGNVSLDTGDSKTVNGKVVLRPSDNLLEYIGLNGQLGDYGIPLARGRSYLVNLGGKNIDGAVKVRFNTPYLRVLPFPSAAREFSEGITGLSFVITVDADTPRGQYSVLVSGEDDLETSLIGAINVD